MELTDPIQQFFQGLSEIGAVTDLFGNDIRGTCQCVFNCLYTAARVNIVRCSIFRNRAVTSLSVKQLRQWLKALFLCYGSACAAFLLIRAVEILKLCKCPGLADQGGELWRELALFLNR